MTPTLTEVIADLRELLIRARHADFLSDVRSRLEDTAIKHLPALLDAAERAERAEAENAKLREAPGYGVIDPDYARVFTVARCIAWSEGYALLMHGSFTRDLDLLAVPWIEGATDAEHLVKRICVALDDLSLLTKDPHAKSQSTERPHGRKSWTLTFKTFGDPRFVDLSVMPRAAQALKEDAS